MGAVTAVTVVVIDVLSVIMSRCPGISRAGGMSGRTLFLQVAARAALAFAGQTWFLGHCVVFLTLGCYFVRAVVHRRMLGVFVARGAMALEDFKHKEEALTLGKRNGSGGGGGGSGGSGTDNTKDSPQGLRGWFKGVLDWFKDPETLDLRLLISFR